VPILKKVDVRLVRRFSLIPITKWTRLGKNDTVFVIRSEDYVPDRITRLTAKTVARGYVELKIEGKLYRGLRFCKLNDSETEMETIDSQRIISYYLSVIRSKDGAYITRGELMEGLSYLD